MTTKLLLEFAFVIFILQVFRLKSYFTPLEIRQQKYDSGKADLEKFIGKNIVNRISIIILVLLALIYIVFYVIGFKLFIGTNLIVLPILLGMLTIYGLIKNIIEVKSDKLKDGLISKVLQPANTGYLIYFVWYVLR